MARATYNHAIAWLAAHDDNEWMREERGTPSTSASLVIDLYSKREAELMVDLARELRHIYPNSWRGKLPWES